MNQAWAPGDRRMSARYAIYALPGAVSPEPLRELAEAWIGRAVDGVPVSPAVPAGWSRSEVDAITIDARRYGFHATLKAPFRLSDGSGPEKLDAAVAAFARRAAPVTVPRVGLHRLDGFYALMAGEPAPALHALADEVVREFDVLRAPMTDAERARRRPDNLSGRQRELLDEWGYPYVFDQFRAHFTLTDRIPEPDSPRVASALTGWFSRALDRDVLLDALCVFEEPEPGAPFVLRSTHPLQDTRRGGA